MKASKKCLALLLVFCMVLTMLPVAALATEGPTAERKTVYVDANAEAVESTYRTIQEAVDALGTELGDIVLKSDLTLTGPVLVPADRTITVKSDGEAKTISFAGGGVFSGRAENNLEGLLSGTVLTVENVNFKNTNGTSQGYAALINFNSSAKVTLTGCTFENLYCAVYANPVTDPAAAGPAVTISKCTYKDTTYGYSVDDITDGAISGKATVSFDKDNTGLADGHEQERFPTTVAAVRIHNGTTYNYQTLAGALAAAEAGDTVKLMEDVEGAVTVNAQGVVIDGNGFTIHDASAANALTVAASDVTLKQLTVLSESGIALLVQENAANLTVEGGTYKTAAAGPSYDKQGEGAMRFLGGNGDITITGAQLRGGIHVLNYESGKLAITGNTIGFDYTGETAFVGILVWNSQDAFPADVTLDALKDNSIAAPNENSYYIQIAKQDWTTDEAHSQPASEAGAVIGETRYQTLAAAVAAVQNDETIQLLKDNSEKVTVGRVVHFTVDFNGHSFTGSVTAGSGYAVSEIKGDGKSEYLVNERKSSNRKPSKTYSVYIEDAKNGEVTAGTARATRGTQITLTVSADKGYVLDRLSITDASGDKVDYTKKNDTKYTFDMPASQVTVKATFQQEGKTSSLPFKDVDSGDWFYEAVQYVSDNETMNGTSSTRFSPNSKLNRAMIAQILYNLEGKPSVRGSAFSDVPSNAWYADAVNWAAEQRIVLGYGSGAFGPENNITREQMAAILYRYAQYKDYDVSASGDLTKYRDGDSVSDWAEDAMQWAVGAKLCTGKSSNVLDPTSTATRAEVAQIMMNFCENIAK